MQKQTLKKKLPGSHVHKVKFGWFIIHHYAFNALKSQLFGSFQLAVMEPGPDVYPANKLRDKQNGLSVKCLESPLHKVWKQRTKFREATSLTYQSLFILQRPLVGPVSCHGSALTLPGDSALFSAWE